MARVLISGITGQDGSYLTESHLSTGDEVHGLVRQSSLLQRTRLDALPALSAAREEGRLKLHYADLSDTSSLVSVLRGVKPGVIYHLAGQSHVKISFDLPEYTADSTGLGTLRLLESMRHVVPDCRFFLAATSEIFGEAKESPQNEQTPMNPINPYAAAKVYALNLVRIYRSAYGLFACAGILFNHESPRRGENYVTRKIARGAASIARVSAAKPDDYVLASGVSHSVGDFCEAAFRIVGLDYKKHVVLDPQYARPVDITETRGDSSKARKELGWAPKTGFEELVRIMVDAELAELDGRGDAA
jgi:GDPmannose 4,6-dehydratase